MNAIIIYGSHHHGNTRKVVEAISKELNIDTVDAENEKVPDLTTYDKSFLLQA